MRRKKSKADKPLGLDALNQFGLSGGSIRAKKIPEIQNPKRQFKKLDFHIWKEKEDRKRLKSQQKKDKTKMHEFFVDPISLKTNEKKQKDVSNHTALQIDGLVKANPKLKSIIELDTQILTLQAQKEKETKNIENAAKQLKLLQEIHEGVCKEVNDPEFERKFLELLAWVKTRDITEDIKNTYVQGLLTNLISSDKSSFKEEPFSRVLEILNLEIQNMAKFQEFFEQKAKEHAQIVETLQKQKKDIIQKNPGLMNTVEKLQELEASAQVRTSHKKASKK